MGSQQTQATQQVDYQDDLAEDGGGPVMELYTMFNHLNQLLSSRNRALNC